MDRGVPIGRVCGFPLTVHWSVLIVLWLFTWSLASGLAETTAGRPSVVYWTAGLVGASTLLASLLLHELTHAIVARRHGVTVKSIQLWLLGGVARLADEPTTPRTAFWVAASGPLTSFVLAGGFTCAAVLFRVAAVSDVVIAVTWWLAGVNLILALFNLLPAAPLDGGRLLRAVLWHRQGDAVRSAVTAARAGRIVGCGLICFGLLEVMVGAIVGGLWLMFVGWFLFTAARDEEWSVLTRRALADAVVGDVATAAPHTVPAWITIDRFIEDYLLVDRHSGYPVLARDGSLTGLITLTQVRSVPFGERATTTVGEAAQSLDHVPTAALNEPVFALIERLAETGAKRALVLDSGLLVGIVTSGDLTRLIDVVRLSPPHPAASVPLTPPTVVTASPARPCG